ncbi:stage II sporulation protein M [Lactobacillus paracasei subsp. paracasei]|uniref:stage II sporulation protein M n=1 Tax=Lacticaseibacillus paracasei TaxID=1597 RepID=UPI0018C5D246|nr:stage II sporulation protein M [Lacticaseibacillus paracasei]MBG1273404.1 stage II sporulation protein M [Lacticaseibacillus paracasei subsp. paracasei]
MKKRLGYNLNVIGHYLLIGWLIFFGVTIFVGLVTYLVMGANPNFVRGIFTGLSGKFANTHDSLSAFWAILVNNERVAFGLMIIGMIPITFLYWISYYLTCASVGLVLGIYAAKLGIGGALAAFVLGILPHGILEMSALIIGVALAAQVNKALRQSIKRFFADPYYRKSSLDVKAIALQYVCIIIPMIAVAALIEGFVTPALLRLLVH